MRCTIGAAALAALWLGPLPAMSGASVLAHMMLHIGLVAVVPALLGLRLPLPGAPLVLALAAFLEMIVVWGWHAPPAHLWARFSPLGFAAEQSSFLAAGILLWSAAHAAGAFGGAVLLLGTTMHMTLLGAIIGLASRPIYGEICAGYFSLDFLEEQQLAGALMAVGGGGIYMIAALARLAPELRANRPDARAATEARP
jgi:putative membrane protein